MDEATKEVIVANIETKIEQSEAQEALLRTHLKAVETASTRIAAADDLLVKLAANARLAYWDDELGNWHDMEFYTGEIANSLVLDMLNAHKANLESELATLQATYAPTV